MLPLSAVPILYSELPLHKVCAVRENIIGTTKIRNNYGAIQLLIFPIFGLSLYCKCIALFFASFIVSVLFFIALSKVIALPTIAIAWVVALSHA